jgi:aminocarboxymuconate-semialdehyde decarboxylase
MAPTSDPVIDAHAHLVPPRLGEALERARAKLPSISPRTGDDGKLYVAFPTLTDPRPVPPRVLSRDQSHEFMDAQGVDTQIVGIWADLFGYDLPPAEGAYWASMLNDMLLEEAAASGRMVALATLPLQDTAAAVKELERCLGLGYKGVTIGPSVGADANGASAQLDAERLGELWSALADQQVPVVLHPMFLTAEARIRDYGLPNTVGRPHDTNVAVARLLYSGRLAQHPDLRILLVHGGGGVPYLWGRLQRNAVIGPGELADPDAGLGTLWFDTVVYRPEALQFLLGFAGTERVLLGSDYPFPIMDPRPNEVVDRLDVPDATRAAIRSGNARALFGL